MADPFTEFEADPFSEYAAPQAVAPAVAPVADEFSQYEAPTQDEFSQYEALQPTEDIATAEKVVPAGEAFLRETVGSVAQMPRFLQEAGSVPGDRAINALTFGMQEDEETTGIKGVLSDYISSISTPMGMTTTPMKLAERIPFVKKLNDKIEEFGVKQIKESEQIRDRFTEEKEGIIKLTKERRVKDLGNKIGEMAIFETPRLAMQTLLAYISGGASLGYMGLSSASRKYGALAEEDITPQQRVNNAVGTGAVEFLSEKLGTGRVLDKAFSGKFKKGVGAKIKELIIGALGGAVSEGSAQVGENLLDQMVGMDADLGDGVAEALLMGALFDSGLSMAGTIKNARSTKRFEDGLRASGATEQEVQSIIADAKSATTDEELNEVDRRAKEVMKRNRTDNNKELRDTVESARADEILEKDTLSEVDLEELNDISESVDATMAYEIQQKIKRKQQEVQDATIREPQAGTEQEETTGREQERVPEATAREPLQEPGQAEGVQVGREPTQEEATQAADLQSAMESDKAPEPTPVVEGESDTVGLSKRWDKVNNKLEFNKSMLEPEREAQTSLIRSVFNKGLHKNVDVILNKINKGLGIGREEMAALLIRKTEVMNEIDAIRKQMETATERELVDLNAELDALVNAGIGLTNSIRQAGTELGRAISMMAAEMDKKTYDLVNVLEQYRKNTGDARKRGGRRGERAKKGEEKITETVEELESVEEQLAKWEEEYLSELGKDPLKKKKAISELQKLKNKFMPSKKIAKKPTGHCIVIYKPWLKRKRHCKIKPSNSSMLYVVLKSAVNGENSL